MPRVNNVARTGRTWRRVIRGAQLRCTSSNEDIAQDLNNNGALINDEDDHMETKDRDVPPSPIVPPSTIIQGASSSKKINAMRGWT